MQLTVNGMVPSPRASCEESRRGEEYSLADIKWYSITPGLERMIPDSVTPRIQGRLDRMAARPAVQRLEDFRHPA